MTELVVDLFVAIGQVLRILCDIILRGTVAIMIPILTTLAFVGIMLFVAITTPVMAAFRGMLGYSAQKGDSIDNIRREYCRKHGIIGGPYWQRHRLPLI